jgi:hypothetical protein
MGAVQDDVARFVDEQFDPARRADHQERIARLKREIPTSVR